MPEPLPADDLGTRLLTRKETAKLLRRSQRFVDGLLAAGVLPKVKIGGVLIPLDAVLAYIKSCTEGNKQ